MSDLPDGYKKQFTTSTEEEQEKASVDDAETVIEFSELVHSWRLYNDGSDEVHYSLETGVSTDSFKIPPRAGIVEDVPVLKIYLICAAGESATVFACGIR